MGRSATPRRRKAAASALRYEHRPGRPDSADRKQKDTGVTPAGCLVGPGVAGLFILMATFDWLWGDDIWQWPAEARPGGAYGFAVSVGAAGPCLAALSLFCLSHMG